MAAELTGANRGPRRLGRSRLLGCLLAAGSVAVAGCAALGGASAFASPARGVEASRRGVLLGGTALLSQGLAPQPASAASEAWREDIPRALRALKSFQKNWGTITREGLERAGAETVRKAILTEWNEDMEIKVPAGQSLGVTLQGVTVSSAKSPWMNGDVIKSVNGEAVNAEFTLVNIVKDAQASNTALNFGVQRPWPSPFTDFERKLKNAYEKLADPDLADLEEVQVRVGNIRALVGMAAGAPSSADGTLKDLRKEIDTLVTELTPVVQAIG